MVEDFLSQKGIGFKKRDVSADTEAAQELVNNTGQMGVPVTIINGQTIVGFDQAKLEQAISRKQKVSFGVSVADASRITSKAGMSIILGAYLGRIRSGSSAERVGLKRGDIITEFNMQNIANAKDFEKAISNLNEGSRFSIVFLRGNQRLSGEGII